MPDQTLVVAYGGGVNSVATLVLLAQLGLTPHAIVMADPGSERRATIAYRDNVMPAWLESHGFPHITTINRIDEGQFNPRAWRLETLYDECIRTKALPSVAYGWKKCSSKYKGDTQRWWFKRQPWAHELWRRGGKIVKVIGYDAGEERRVRKAFQNEWEDAHFTPWYPLVEQGYDREGCERLITSAGLPLPPKSACTFCPNNKLWEWELIRKHEPDRFAQAVEMSRNAVLDKPDVVGLMRCNPHGKRQLHVWADGGYPELHPSDPDDDDQDEMPCECAL